MIPPHLASRTASSAVLAPEVFVEQQMGTVQVLFDFIQWSTWSIHKKSRSLGGNGFAGKKGSLLSQPFPYAGMIQIRC